MVDVSLFPCPFNFVQLTHAVPDDGTDADEGSDAGEDQRHDAPRCEA